MSNIIEIVLSAEKLTPGVIFAYLVLIVVIGILALLAISIIKKIPHIKSFKIPGIHTELSMSNGESSKTPLNIETLKLIFDSSWEKYLISRLKIKNTYTKDIEDAQNIALRNALNLISLMYASSITEKEEISSQAILELYLERDFTKTLKDKLNILADDDVACKSDIDINTEIQNITQDTIREMKSNIKKYIIIGDNLYLSKLFDDSAAKIRDELAIAIKKFINYSKKEQASLLKAAEAKESAINDKIIKLFGEDY